MNLKSFFTSVKLTIGLLIAIAGVSILGTLIPQGGMSEEFARKLGPGLISVFNVLQLFDLYHSIWFFLLMGLLTANLVACSWVRFPATLRLLRKSEVSQPGSAFKDTPLAGTMKLDGSPDDFSKKIESVLGGHRFRKIQTSENIIYGEKGAFSHFGVYFITSVCRVHRRGGYRLAFGFDGFANVPVSGSVDFITLKSGKGMHKLDFLSGATISKPIFTRGARPRSSDRRYLC